MIITKQIEKKIQEILSYSKAFSSVPVSEQELLSKLDQVEQIHGLEGALNALDSTHKTFKTKAKEVEKIEWSKVKNEIYNTYGSVPTSINVIKSDIRNGHIEITGLQSEPWIRENLQF